MSLYCTNCTVHGGVHKLILKIGRYKVEYGRKSGEKKICPLSLEEITDPNHIPVLPNGKLLIKKPDYALIKVTRSLPFTDRMLKILKRTRDSSRSFVILYVNNTFVGYKSKEGTFFLPSFSKKEYTDILEAYEPKKQRKKTAKYKAVATKTPNFIAL